MKIIFTGTSSFTGYWFVKQLLESGHEVTTTFTRAGLGDYQDGIRGKRVRLLSDRCRSVFGVRFGDDRFLDLISEVRPDVLCHHGADATDYKSEKFNFCLALDRNTHRLVDVLHRIREADCNRLLLTGSVFEGDEGAGSDKLAHFSPYGLSKALTSTVFEHFCATMGFSLGKFVIPNPFGPYEEPRFTAYLIRAWYAGETPEVRTPNYVRDNIHVSLLAKNYERFAADLPKIPGFWKLNPSGYVESQGAFAIRFATEMRNRLGLSCPVQLAVQHQFSEPRIRVNTDPCEPSALNWNEKQAWDEVANYYQSLNPAIT